MKIFIFIFIAMFTITSGCKKKGESITETKELSINAPQNIVNAAFTISNLIDTRCPINALCIGVGKASISLKVQTGSDIKSFTLCFGNCEAGASDVVSFTSGNIRYTVKLKDITPYPAYPGNDAKIHLEITRKYLME